MKYSDISKPAYNQLRKHNENDDFDEESSFTHETAKRTIELIVTDGARTMRAIEISTWTSLKFPLDSGIKIRLQPPIATSENVLFLNDKNIRVLGGGMKNEGEKSIEIAHLESRIIAAGGEPPKREVREKSALDSLCPAFAKKKQKVETKPVVNKQPAKQQKMTSFFTAKPKAETKMEVDDEWSDDETFENLSSQVPSSNAPIQPVNRSTPIPSVNSSQPLYTQPGTEPENDDWDDDIPVPLPVKESVSQPLYSQPGTESNLPAYSQPVESASTPVEADWDDDIGK